jgi:clan AA aspartic protease (TIGR02281 family)
MSYLQTALEKGYRRIAHVRHDDDLAPVRAMPEFEEMIRPYEEKVSVVTRTRDAVPDSEAISLSDDIEIPFIPTGGVTEVSCTINDLPLKFIFDTGASTVSLSMVEANFMMKNGYLKHSDVVGSQNFFDANGDISEGTVINLRKIDFGGLKLDNVRASVVRNQKAPLLLGQTVLGRLGKIEIDNTRRKLIITPRTTSDVE